MATPKTNFFVGVKNGKRKVVPIIGPITAQVEANLKPLYSALIGPFLTKRGAKFCAENPSSTCQQVSEFEKSAKDFLQSEKEVRFTKCWERYEAHNATLDPAIYNEVGRGHAVPHAEYMHWNRVSAAPGATSSTHYHNQLVRDIAGRGEHE